MGAVSRAVAVVAAGVEAGERLPGQHGAYWCRERESNPHEVALIGF